PLKSSMYMQVRVVYNESIYIVFLVFGATVTGVSSLLYTGIDLANDGVQCGQRRLAIRPMMACSVATSSTPGVGAAPGLAAPCSSSLLETRKEQLLRQHSRPPTSSTFELADPPSPPASSACRSAAGDVALPWIHGGVARPCSPACTCVQYGCGGEAASVRPRHGDGGRGQRTTTSPFACPSPRASYFATSKTCVRDQVVTS
uniref:Uncharacterized protein n=1 Tax=Aegilops tauschii subsp. strangulata TaxID=200361 RepID=A0A453NXE0_AEGTS